MEKELRTDRQQLFGRTYEFGEDGNPVQDSDEEGHPKVGPDGKPVAKRRPGVNDDDILDLNDDVRFHMADKEVQARDHYRGQLVAEYHRLGLDPNNIGARMNGMGFYGDQADLGRMAQELKRVQAIKGDKNSAEAKAFKSSAIQEREANGWVVPMGNDEAVVHDEMLYYLDPKNKQQGGRQGGRGGAAGTNDQMRMAKFNARKQKEAATIAHRRAIGLRKMDQENWYKQQDYQDKIRQDGEKRANLEDDRRKQRDFGYNIGQISYQSGLQLAGQFSQKPMDSAYRMMEARFAATDRMLARMQPNGWDIVAAMLGGGRGRRA